MSKILYVVTNIFHYTQERSVPVEQGELFFTINPYYVLDMSKMVNDIQFITPDTQYIPWNEIYDSEWDTVISSSFLGETIKCYRTMDIKKHILVEDGMYDYIKRVEDEAYKSHCALYLSYPQYGYEPNNYACISQLPDIPHCISNKITELYSESLQPLKHVPCSTPVLYTAPINHDYGICTEKEVEEMFNHTGISQLILKKHPRDSYQYNFPNIDVIECDQQIPGQILFSQFNGRHFFMFPSTICLSKLYGTPEHGIKEIIFFQDTNITDLNYINAFSVASNIGAHIFNLN